MAPFEKKGTLFKMLFIFTILGWPGGEKGRALRKHSSLVERNCIILLGMERNRVLIIKLQFVLTPTHSRSVSPLVKLGT